MRLRAVMLAAVLVACGGPMPERGNPEHNRATCEARYPPIVMPAILEFPEPPLPQRLVTGDDYVAVNRVTDWRRARRQYDSEASQRERNVAACMESATNAAHAAAMSQWRRARELPQLAPLPPGSPGNPIYVAPAFFPNIPLR